MLLPECAGGGGGGSQNYGHLFGGPHTENYSILGYILGSPYLGKLHNEEHKQAIRLAANRHQPKDELYTGVLANPHWIVLKIIGLFWL